MKPKSRFLSSFALLIFCLFLLNTQPALAASHSDHWVGTWAAAPVAAPNKTTYGTADTTFREIVHVSLGGNSVRVILTNEFGLEPLTIGAAHIARSAGGSSIDLTSANALTFSGRSSITIPPGALAVSDPVNFKLAPMSDVAVSIFVPAQTISQATQHSFADQTNYSAAGNAVGSKTLEAPQQIASWLFLKGIDVKADDKSGAIVAFGDSITDGAHSTRNANLRWPDNLARRLQADKKTAKLSVINEGIGGNRVLHDGYGPSALARFDRDVIAQAGVKYVIILESINDIGRAYRLKNPEDVVTADDLIAGLSQLATRAHTHGIKVIGATLTPYVGAGYASPAGEKVREAVNQWIRTSDQLDGFVDFDKATQDPSNPTAFVPADNSGDNLHPSDAGYKAMADSIDLKLFKEK
ncbi:MAG TPA: SGNH/GDSL hydrolase family protein [Edaphobacter sp.]|nr:SGNH/GDSL hydrolase family protein [Edaphobacter sp.]